VIDNLAKIAINNGGFISPLIIPSKHTDGTGLCNVSLFKEENGDIIANIRHVHYTLYHSEFNQKFNCVWGCLAYLNPEDDIRLLTGNYLCKLNPNTLEVDTYQKIDTSKNDIKPIWEFHGLEDIRVFRWNNTLYTSGVRRDVKPNGEGRMELCEIEWDKKVCIEKTRDRIEVNPHTYLEKNWVPIFDMPYHFVRWSNPLEIVKINPEDKSKEKVQNGELDIISCETVIHKDNKIKLPFGLRGSSPVIPFGDDGDRMCITHETHFFHHPGLKKDAHYYHRFIIWDKDWNVKSLSKSFKFMGAMIEFCCGLLVKDDNLIMSFGYQDNAAYILKMPTSLLSELEWEDDYILNPKPKKVTWHEPLTYLKKDYNNIKVKFPGLKKISKNYSQCYQDLFVLTCLNGKTNGTYLEIGAGHPFYGNNTALLSELGWKGVSLDFQSHLVDSWKQQRPNDICLLEDAIKVDYIELCKNNNLSNYIDYLQLDIDPAMNTFKALNKIPLDILEFGVITYEHDFYMDENEEWRTKSRNLLLSKGYIMIASNISPDKNSPYEDWWINKKYLSIYNKNIITDTDKDSLFAKNYMING
jgi:hypothetical protein